MPAPGGVERALTDPRELLEVWERGRRQHPVDRALTILGARHREASRRELAEWPLGDRDAALLSMYRTSFGETLEATGTCPECGAAVEANVHIVGLPVSRCSVGGPQGTVRVGARTIDFRLPNSVDLAAVVAMGDPEAARAELLGRLIGGRPPGISTEEAEALEAAIEEADPLTEISVRLACPDCGRSWTESLDGAAFLWTQVEAMAEELLRQVDRLARAYGWTEEDVLALSPVRRRWYVERVDR